jgi:hypothetical protein
MKGKCIRFCILRANRYARGLSLVLLRVDMHDKVQGMVIGSAEDHLWVSASAADAIRGMVFFKVASSGILCSGMEVEATVQRLSMRKGESSEGDVRIWAANSSWVQFNAVHASELHLLSVLQNDSVAAFFLLWQG